MSHHHRRAAAAASLPISGAYVSRPATQVSVLSTYTFSGASIGAADATRRVVAIVHHRPDDNTASLSTVTIAGVSATIDVEAENTGITNERATSIVSALVPTGTTGDIVVTFTAACQVCGIGVYRIINESSAAPTVASDTAMTATVLSAGLTMPGDGVIIAGCTARSGTGVAWTGGTSENYDTDTVRVSGSIGDFSSGAATITATATSGLDPSSLAVAGWV